MADLDGPDARAGRCRRNDAGQDDAGGMMLGRTMQEECCWAGRRRRNEAGAELSPFDPN